MKLKQPINAAFKQGQLTTVYRLTTSTEKDAFGRSEAAQLTPVNSKPIPILRNNSNLSASTQTSKDGLKEPLQANWYFRSTDIQLQPNDCFEASGITWQVNKIISEPALDLLEAFCYETNTNI